MLLVTKMVILLPLMLPHGYTSGWANKEDAVKRLIEMNRPKIFNFVYFLGEMITQER
jgi:hypothetical protein